MSRQLGRIILENIIWFAVSIVLAFFVWFVATVQADPIQLQTYRAIPVVIAPDSGFIVTNKPTDSALVSIRAQRSVISALTRDDITLAADLTGKTAGTHTVPLVVRVSRAGIIATDTQPIQITVTLERIEAEQKPVNLEVVNPPPADFSYDTPTTDVLQAEVQGALGQVSSVVAVRGEIDLSNRRNPLDVDVLLVPINISGNRVDGVTIAPQTIRASVNIYSRPDVRQVTVRPDVLFDTLPDGYVFESIRTEPQVVYISGSPSDLELPGDTIATAPVDLSGHTSSFEVTVPLVLPDSDLLIISGENQVKVNVGISALISARQFDNIRVEVIGQSNPKDITLNPATISVVLNAPVALLDTISAADIQAVIDVNGLAAGNYERQPRILVRQGQVTVNDTQALPPDISVSINPPTPQPEATPEVTPP